MASSAPGFSFRSHFEYLPPPAECLAILVGAAELIVFGLGGLTDTAAFAKGYGLKPSAASAPTSTSTSAKQGAEEEEVELSDAQKTQKGLIAAVAARNVQNGALILTFALYTRDRRALGLAVAYGVVATLADSLIVRKYGVKELVGGHAIGVLNSLLIGGSLLYWGRGDKFFK